MSTLVLVAVINNFTWFLQFVALFVLALGRFFFLIDQDYSYDLHRLARADPRFSRRFVVTKILTFTYGKLDVFSGTPSD